jgi:hypothetical protein
VISGELWEKDFPLPASDLALFTRFRYVWDLDHVETISVNGHALRHTIDHNVEIANGKLGRSLARMIHESSSQRVQTRSETSQGLAPPSAVVPVSLLSRGQGQKEGCQSPSVC